VTGSGTALTVGISQGVADVPERAERRDCLDQAWVGLLCDLDILPIPIPNTLDDIAVMLSSVRLDGVILSGGNDLADLGGAANIAPERDATEIKLLEWTAQRGLPALGVCRGLQIMTRHYGGEVVPVSGHVGIQHRIIVDDAAGLKLAGRAEVNSFHGYGVRREQLGVELLAAAVALDGTVEAVVHREYRHAAIMWHPERSPSDRRDADLIRTFFERRTS